MLASNALYVRPRALVVDDSTTLQRVMDLTLRPLGIDIEFASRGDDAITQALSKTFHVIFLDVMLPGADGYQVCKAIKRDPAAKHTPVIMITSKDSAFDKIKGIMAGTNAYLTKPFDRAKLIAALDQHAPEVLPAATWWLQKEDARNYSKNRLARAATNEATTPIDTPLTTHQSLKST